VTWGWTVVAGSAGLWWVVTLVLDAAALGSLWTSRRHSRRAKTVWTAVVLALPMAGALAWLTLGRERRRGRRRDRRRRRPPG